MREISRHHTLRTGFQGDLEKRLIIQIRKTMAERLGCDHFTLEVHVVKERGDRIRVESEIGSREHLVVLGEKARIETQDQRSEYS